MTRKIWTEVRIVDGLRGVLKPGSSEKEGLKEGLKLLVYVLKDNLEPEEGGSVVRSSPVREQPNEW